MRIYVPSYCRAALVRDRLLPQFPSSMMSRIVVVVQSESECDQYSAALGRYIDQGLNLVQLDCEGISRKRELIGQLARELGEDKMVMIDDDLALFRRVSPEDWHLQKLSPDGVEQMFQVIEDHLDQYAQVGVSAREGNNRLGTGEAPLLRECTRMMRVLAFRVKEYCECDVNRINGIEDFDTVLQLLRRGYKNAVLGYWAHDQSATNAPGGCSAWRTLEVHEANVRELQRLHPEFVTLREKHNKTGGEFGTRTEAHIQWKRAWLSPQSPYGVAS